MSNTKHTPGPWVKDEYGDLKSPDGEQVSVWGLGISHGQRNERREATAALITSAPELLAALEALFDSYKQLADSGDAGNWYLEDLPEGKQALAALAKAKGNS